MRRLPRLGPVRSLLIRWSVAGSRQGGRSAHDRPPLAGRMDGNRGKEWWRVTVAGGERRVVSGRRSGRRRTGGARKAPNKANWNQPLTTCHQGIKVDILGVVYAKQTQFRVVEDRGTLGPTTFPGRQKGGDPAASGDLRLGHRAPGRGGPRASIPLHALTTLLSALGAFCLWEPRSARICLGNLRYICSDNGNASQGADNTSVRAGGVLSVGIPRFLNKSQHFTSHLFRSWIPNSTRDIDGGPRRFTEVVLNETISAGSWFGQGLPTSPDPPVLCDRRSPSP